jgi:hypothetical protein
MSTYESFRPHNIITRAEMAKIIIKYTKMVPEITSSALRATSSIKEEKQGTCTFADFSQAPTDLQPFIIEACELGLMGLDADGKTPKNHFNSNETITLAEVATTVSRLLRGKAYRGSEEWRYHNHLLALQKAGIIPRNADPMRKELRENVFAMLRILSTLAHQ